MIGADDYMVERMWRNQRAYLASDRVTLARLEHSQRRQRSHELPARVEAQKAGTSWRSRLLHAGSGSFR
jgi:hypothetical protein